MKYCSSVTLVIFEVLNIHMWTPATVLEHIWDIFIISEISVG